jgi:hypothetical protein
MSDPEDHKKCLGVRRLLLRAALDLIFYNPGSPEYQAARNRILDFDGKDREEAHRE